MTNYPKWNLFQLSTDRLAVGLFLTGCVMAKQKASNLSAVSSRYNFFIILYPVGVVGELLTIYAALPYVKRSGMFSVRLPNKYNVSFDYYYFLLIIMASYIPCKFQ